MADTLKDQGNKAFQAKEYDRAIELFSEALKLDSTNFVLFSNRSAAKAGKRDWAGALEDAEQVRSRICKIYADCSSHRSQCIKISPTWSKGYARKGAALHGQRRYNEAITAYEAGLKLEDSPVLRKGLKEVQDARGTCICFIREAQSHSFK